MFVCMYVCMYVCSCILYSNIEVKHNLMHSNNNQNVFEIQLYNISIGNYIEGCSVHILLKLIRRLYQ